MFRCLIAIFCCASALAAFAQGARYEVRLALDSGDDPAAVVRQIAATYRVCLESDEAAPVLVVSASEASGRLLAKDRRVTLVQPVPVATTTTGFGTYEYDGSGNIITAGADTFVYDKLGRIHQASIAGVEQTFTYDRHGNITRIATTGESGGDIGVGTGNRLSAATYDGSGNLVSYHGGTFVYDGLNVVTESTPTGGNRHLYIYTASNERIATTELLPGGQQQSEWTLRDPDGRVLRRLEKNASGVWSWKEDYIYRGSQLLAAEVPTPEKVRHFHLDHLGTPRLITGNGGAKLAERAYGAFGRGFAVAPSGIHEDLEFTGHERDNFQLDYMHARYYDPMLGRFLAVDPTWESADLSKPQSWNRYSYVMNNPVKLTDPDGKCPLCIDVLVDVLIDGDAPLFEKGYDPAVSDNPPRSQAEFDQRVRQGRAVRSYDVGTFDELKANSTPGDKIDIHHAPQAKPAGQGIPNYDPAKAPAIAVPQREHQKIPTQKGTYTGSARDLVAKDVRDLRNHTNAPNSALQKLVKLIKDKFPEAMKKILF